MSRSLIEIQNVSVVRESNLILDRVSISIPRYRHTAILGPNGSGKSSLTKLLMRHFYPSVESDGHQGTVNILGKSDWEVAELWRRMGMVTPVLDQDFSDSRTGKMSVTEAVASGFNGTRLREYGPRITAEMSARIDDVIEMVGMETMRDRTLRTLSTGERRRVMIARAIVHQPDIFVLDEPTNGLDIVARSDFLRILSKLLEQTETTILLVTHHVDEIPPEMSHVVQLKDGQIVYDGKKGNGLTRDSLSKLFDSPITVTCEDGWYRARLH